MIRLLLYVYVTTIIYAQETSKVARSITKGVRIEPRLANIIMYTPCAAIEKC